MDIKLFNGDCMDLFKTLPDNSIDCAVTDPPYRIAGADSGIMHGVLSRENANVRKGKLFSENDIHFETWLPELARVLKDGAHAYIMINGKNIASLQNAAEAAGFKFLNLLVWKKNNKTFSQYYMKQTEFIMLFRKGTARCINALNTPNFFDVKNILGGHKLHPTEKPVELLETFVKNSTAAGETVIDPFMGAGSTGAACVSTGRNFIGFELDRNYYETARQRLAGGG